MILVKHLGLTTWFALGAIAAAGACGEADTQTPLGGGTGGVGGNAGVAGTGGVGGNAGIAGTAGVGGTAGMSSLECQGPPQVSGAGGNWVNSPRREGIECYVADATNGVPECMPADDPALVEQVSDALTSCGFATEFVIAAVESQPVLAECEALGACCAAFDASRYAACFDLVDDLEQQPSCGDRSLWSVPECDPSGGADASVDAGATDAGADAGATDAGDGGAAHSSRHALCCYRVCGYTHCP